MHPCNNYINKIVQLSQSQTEQIQQGIFVLFSVISSHALASKPKSKTSAEVLGESDKRWACRLPNKNK